MKRDWDVIRQVLLEVEALSEEERSRKFYGTGRDYPGADEAKALHALLLWQAGFLNGVDGSTLAGDGLLAPNLTWAGHDLLATLNSKPVWDRIKSTARDKGIELTFDTVKVIGKQALDWVLSQT